MNISLKINASGIILTSFSKESYMIYRCRYNSLVWDTRGSFAPPPPPPPPLHTHTQNKRTFKKPTQKAHQIRVESLNQEIFFIEHSQWVLLHFHPQGVTEWNLESVKFIFLCDMFFVAKFFPFFHKTIKVSNHPIYRLFL